MTQVLISFGNFTTNLNFWIPTGSVATYLRCGGEMIYWKFPFLSSGEKFWKSDEIWRSYGTFLEHSVYNMIWKMFGTNVPLLTPIYIIL